MLNFGRKITLRTKSDPKNANVRTRKPLYVQTYRGFESHPLRQFIQSKQLKLLLNMGLGNPPAPLFNLEHMLPGAIRQMGTENCAVGPGIFAGSADDGAFQRLGHFHG